MPWLSQKWMDLRHFQGHATLIQQVALLLLVSEITWVTRRKEQEEKLKKRKKRRSWRVGVKTLVVIFAECKCEQGVQVVRYH